MKHKMFFAFLLLTLLVSGCGVKEKRDLDLSPASAFRSIFNGESAFLSADLGESIYLGEIKKAVTSDDRLTVSVERFAVVDLEGDNAPEIILELTVKGSGVTGFVVLRCDEGEISGHTLWHRAFRDLKADGTFSFSGGAADSGFGKIVFGKHGLWTDKVSHSESSFDSHNNLTVSYRVDGKISEKDAFLAALEKQSEKKDALWLDFTEEEVERALLQIEKDGAP